MRGARSTIWPALVLVLAVSPVVERAALGQDEEPRFHARLTDGTFVAGEVLRDWHDVNATPRIGSHALFDPNRPVQWLVRDGAVFTPATACIEFVGGDRLPGEVVGYSTGAESPYRRLPPHLIVRPAAAFRRPNTEFDPPLRIELKHVRRVVWATASGEPLAENAALKRDGRRVSFRALRWGETSVALLLDDRIETVPFHELAEVRLAGGDAWDAYVDHAATLLPEGEGRLIQIETTGGFVALTSLQRLRAEAYGDNRRVEHWYQTIQPAWSLDPLWVPVSSVAAWRFFAPERVPVTLLAPRVTRTGVVFSAARDPQINRTVAGDTLNDGASFFGWGIGTHAPCRLDVPLPPGAVAFRGSYALDPAVGGGGCAKGRVLVEQAGETSVLHESGILVGAAAAHDMGRLTIPPAAPDAPHARTLVLLADPVVENRPAGADPFDIRDALNWLAPQLELDPAFIKAELRRRALSRLPGLAGWDVVPATSELATVVTRWDTRNWEDPRFRTFAAVEAGYALLSRTLRIREQDRALAVFAHCPHDEFRPARIQVRLDGVVIGEQPVPVEHGRKEPDPLLFPVGEHAGRTVRIDVVQLPGAINEPKPAAVDWRGIELVEHRPGLLRLFEDDAAFAAQLAEGDGSITLEPSEPQTGRASLRIGPPGRQAATIPGWNWPIVEEPDFGEYRFVRFAWKSGGRGPIALSIGHEGRFGPGEGVTLPARSIRRPPSKADDRGPRNGYRYVAGPRANDDVELTPSITLDERPPESWKVVQRDLFADFGPLTTTGLGATTRDGTLSLDGLYLARSPEQFRFIEADFLGPPQPQAGEGDVRLLAKDSATWAPLVAAVAEQFGLSGQGGELQLLHTYRGRMDVLRTLPEGGDEKQAARLTAAVELPPGKRSQLKMSVSPHARNETEHTEWELQVFANGRELLARKIDQAATTDGWLDLTVDLAEFAGRPVRLELRHKPGGRNEAFAYWHNVRIETE